MVLSAAFHSSPCRDLSHSWLDIFLGILLFLWLLYRDCVLDLALSLDVLVYRNATDFCTLIWYPKTLLKLLIGFRRFWAEMKGVL